MHHFLHVLNKMILRRNEITVPVLSNISNVQYCHWHWHCRGTGTGSGSGPGSRKLTAPRRSDPIAMCPTAPLDEARGAGQGRMQHLHRCAFDLPFGAGTSSSHCCTRSRAERHLHLIEKKCRLLCWPLHTYCTTAKDSFCCSTGEEPATGTFVTAAAVPQQYPRRPLYSTTTRLLLQY